MKTEYTIVKCDGLFTSRDTALIDEVNRLMKDGWQPLGNPFQDNHGLWLQALTRQHFTDGQQLLPI